MVRETIVKKTLKHPWLKVYPQEIKWDTKIPEAPLYELFDTTAERYPDRYAIDFLSKKYTYQEVADLINKAAKGLQTLGVKKDIKVGIFMPNCPAFIIFYYAIVKAGGTVVNFNPLYAAREVATQIKDSEAEIMVTLDLDVLYSKLYPMFAETNLKKLIICPLKHQLPFPKSILFPIFKHKEVAKIQWDDRHINFSDLINNDGAVAKVDINIHEDIAVLQYTGGTTGAPKGAMLTHANVYANAEQANLWYIREEDAQEKILAALPFFHVFAMTAVLNIAIRMGGEIVIMFPRFQVDDAMKMIEKYKITFFPAVPTIYTVINNHPDVKKYNLKSLRFCLSGGAPLPMEVKKEFEGLTGCKLVEAYGLSETSPAATSNPVIGPNKTGSIGIPFPGTIIKIMSLEDPKKEVKQGEKGEICIQGPQVMKGYWKRPEETKKTLVKNLLRTGDVGYMDEEGYIFLVDRIKDVIICSGYNVYPRHVEEAIYLHQAVEEVTVIGISDPKRGETVKAFVKLRVDKSLTSSELLAFLEDKLSAIELPKVIEFRNELPKTMIGKLSKKELVQEEKQKLEKKNKL